MQTVETVVKVINDELKSRGVTTKVRWDTPAHVRIEAVAPSNPTSAVRQHLGPLRWEALVNGRRVYSIQRSRVRRTGARQHRMPIYVVYVERTFEELDSFLEKKYSITCE